MPRLRSTLLGLSLLAPVSSFAESSEVIAHRADVPAYASASERGVHPSPLLSHRMPPLIARPEVLWIGKGDAIRFQLELPTLTPAVTDRDARPNDALSSLGIDLESAVPPLLHYESKDSQVSLLLAPGGGCTACLKLEGVF